MNWFIKRMARSGYLDPQLFGDTKVNWSLREKELSESAQKIQKEAEIIAEQLGHKMKPWSIINSSECERCAKSIHIWGIHSTAGPKMSGRALQEECKELHDNPYDLPEYRMNAYML